MKIGLADCNLISSSKEHYIMPLSLLSLARMTEKSEHSVELLQASQLKLNSEHLVSFGQRYAEFIAERQFDILGFTTRCDTLPLVIEVAKQHKLLNNNIPIILGGPGATFVDKQLLKNHSFIDVIVRGEGEITFAELLSAFEKRTPLCDVKGISFRDVDGQIVTTENQPPVDDLDLLPAMPFHLIDNTLRNPELIRTDIMAGRGCPLGCKYCSTCVFWGKKVRRRSPEKIVSEMKLLNQEYGFRYLYFSDDNLLGRKDFFQELCQLIRQNLPGLKWGISASTNLASPHLVETLAHSGCKEAFIGIETGSERLSSYIPRKDHQVKVIQEKLNCFRTNNIRITKSFMIGFPDENIDDINKTLMLAIETQALSRIDLMEMTQLHPLGIHPGTELYDKYHNRLSFTGAIGDCACPAICNIERCMDFCKQYPKIFTAYASHMNKDDYSFIIELCNFYRLLVLFFPRTIFVLLMELSLSPIDFTQHLKKYMHSHGTDLASFRDNSHVQSTEKHSLLQIFPKVVKKLYHDADFPQSQIRLFMDAEQPSSQVILNRQEKNSLYSREILEGGALKELVPVLPKTTQIHSLLYNPDELFLQFYQNGRIGYLSNNCKLDLAYYMPRHYVGNPGILGYNIHKLNELTSFIIHLVNGIRSCNEIVNEIARIVKPHQRASFCKGIMSSLKKLIKSGILMFSEECS
ncbi:MAG: B12-binding domain-containing radical SAM protein [Candidatus Hodarchaeota archaeon]